MFYTLLPLSDLSVFHMSSFSPDSFNPEEGLKYSQWLKVFNQQITLRNIKQEDALFMIPTLFKGNALEIYATICDEIDTLEDLHSRMMTFFPEFERGLHKKFWQLTKQETQSVRGYYFEKVKIGTQLHMPKDLVLESLTSGAGPLEKFLIASSPHSLEDWLRIAESLEHTTQQRDGRWNNGRRNNFAGGNRPNMASRSSRRSMEMSTPANSTNLAILGLHPSAYKVRRTPVIKAKWDVDGARGSERMWGQQTHGSWGLNVCCGFFYERGENCNVHVLCDQKDESFDGFAEESDIGITAFGSDSFQEKPPKKTTAIFLNMTSAFDRVWREKLCEKLHNIGTYSLESRRQNKNNLDRHFGNEEPVDEISLTTCGLVDPPFSENEVKLAAFKFGKRKSPGPEGIDNTVVKALVRRHPSLLSRLFNRCLDTGTFSEVWKIARVVLLEKSGKVLDSLLAQRLKHWLESNELLSSFQHGFREGKSTTTALNEVLEGIEMGLNKGAWVLFVALDIDGALNSMSWNKLMRNLMDMGCPDNLCSLVRDFLRDRWISLSFGGRKLERNCARGCPQGFCCGPILWNILVNTVFQEELPEGARLVLYADDQTISCRLVANGLHSCRPLRRLPLTPPNRRQRLEWCRARSTWMTEWHRVVFSDESRFCLSSDSRRVRVWRRRGERSNPAAIVERPTVRQRGIMVWGAIAYDSRSPLLRIQGTMTAQRYVDDVLRPVTLPYLQGVPNALYQQDNARPHTARISQQALQDVQMLPWPPYSPDLSPIEHVWDIIGRRLHALPQPRSEDELWQMVEREWRAIPQDAIRTLIDSLPRRVAACIAVRGGPTC
ncbi:hypothetical protein LAZ67_2002358 [Cordylochernes scorpioides]|uniref:Uncharacterized protein n=1 Tax=Cordylochernes scorpioides TaxID=51811 RepID=A0ABY6K279_9ARAC|nr:hypothetical protein LAZ67_2002358 [Cordylochernes scorpioides]